VRYGVIPAREFGDRAIVYNPGYGTGLCKWGSRPLKRERADRAKHARFDAQLEQSILKNGFRNPVQAYAWGGLWVAYGISRMIVAKKHSLDVPTIVLDFEDRYPDLMEIPCEESAIRQLFDFEVDKVWIFDDRIEIHHHGSIVYGDEEGNIAENEIHGFYRASDCLTYGHAPRHD
jgi:hypothetical protein